MGLPASGIISSSQVGVYTFDLTSTQEFSLSASLAGTTVNKGYTTTLGPLWRGTGTSGPGGNDVNNLQYNQGANNFSLSDWYNYYKGFEFTRSARNGDPSLACDDLTEFAPIYVTDAIYWGAGSEYDIVDNATQGYTNTSGTTVFAGNSEYYKIFELNKAYQITNNGIFGDGTPC
jgi:hypothetical protein